MKKLIVNPIIIGMVASTVIVGCGTKNTDDPKDKPACIYNISGGKNVDISFGTAYSDSRVDVTQDGKKVTDIKKEGVVNSNKLGIYKVTYSSSSCSNSEIRTVNVIPSVCAYNLVGSNPLEVVLNGVYGDPGVKVKDINNKTIEYKTEGKVEVDKEGDYTITYKGNGCKNSQTRVVKVKATPTACNYELKGANPLIVSVNDDYVDLGVTVKNADTKIVDKVTISGDNVNSAIAKDYEVIYKGEGCSNEGKRTVKVVAPTKCSYTLKGENPFKLTVGTDYEEPGFTIKDADAKVVIGMAVDSIKKDEVGEYEVIYQDASCENSAKRIVKVVVADCAYSFVEGTNPLTLKKGDTYTDVKPTVKDASGAEINASDISVTNDVKTAIGSYEVVYQAKDCPNTATRKVEIIPLVCTYTPKDGPATIVQGNKYTDPGVIVVPNVAITTTGSIDTNALGKQSIKYQGESCENSVERFVEVVKPNRPDPKTVLPNL